MVQEDDKLSMVRRAVPVAEKIAYLNAGSYGPLTAAAGEAVAKTLAVELQEGRLGSKQFERIRTLKDVTRAGFAIVLGCDADEVALTTSTTAGMNFACWGLDWRDGDEVVTTDVEHLGGLAPLYILENRFGVRIRMVNTDARGENLLDGIEAAIGSRTRAVVVSHVSWSAGIVLPLQEIAELAHRAGALLIVDGAQSAGAIRLDMRALGVDAYAIPGQKWLCGPEGTGALYVSRERLSEISASHAGSGAFESFDELGRYEVQQDARRFNTPGNPFGPAVAGMQASLDWFLDDVGQEWAYARILENAARCRALLEEIDGVEVITPPGEHAGLVHFSIAGQNSLDVDAELLRRGVLVRHLRRPECIRVSTGFYNTEADLHALADGVREILKH